MSSATYDIFQRHRLTVAEYHRMGDTGIFSPDARVELIEGEVIDMPPIGSPHASTVFLLSDRLRDAVKGVALVWVQNPIRLSQHSEPQPNVALLRPRPDFYHNAHPTPAGVFLIVEVADTTLAYDTQIKMPLYARHGIPEAWIVDLPNRQFISHRTPTSTGFRDVQTLADLSAVSTLLLPGVTIDLSGLF